MKRINFFRLIFIAIAISGFTFMVFAQAVPPDLVNYQGILRDSSDNPLDGNYDITFQFFNVDAGGQAILIDEHLVAGTGAVTVTNGLFNAHLGGGAVSDGPDPGGTYTTLTQVFRDYGNVYLEVKVYNIDTTSWETLSPRIRIISAAYALNTDHLDGTNSDQFLRSDTGDSFTSGILTMDSGTTLDVNGTLQMDGSVTKATTDLVTNFNSDLLDGLHSSSFSLTGHAHPGSDITSPVSDASNADTLDGFDSTYFLNTSTSPQAKSGPLALDASGAVAFGIETYGQSGGGYFNDSDNSGFAYVGYGDRGIEAYGNEAGGYFADSSAFGYAYLGYSNSGIAAYGDVQGGYFKDTDSTGYARVGYDDTGISSYGDISGGYFADAETFPSGYAYVGKLDYGIEAHGNRMGGYFKDANDSGYAYAGDGHYGISAWGNTAGGYFKDADDTGYALVGSGDTGIYAYGDTAGGYFADSQITPSAYAYVGQVNYGIEAHGNITGGYFKDADDSGYANVGYGNYGIYALGDTAGGYFEDLNNSGYANVGYGDFGIDARGNTAGGYFKDLTASGYAYVGYGNTGISAYGNFSGGYFDDIDSSAYARLAYGDSGITAFGNTQGGYFEDLNSSGNAHVAFGDDGIVAHGNDSGGFFSDIDHSGLAYVAYGNRGIWGKGTFAGATFSHPDDTTYWADVSTSTHKIVGTGGVSFVQNHPYDKSKVVTYTAPEGDEVAVYTRGTARLINGEALVKLGESFSWVANPDIGLTAHITPRGEKVLLSVDSLTTSEMTVSGPEGSNTVFDYIVFGLRIGFEELAVAQDKEREAFLPEPEAVQEPYDLNPDLRDFNPLERFKRMRQAIGETGEIDLTRSQALANAIDENKQEILAKAREKMELEKKQHAHRPEKNQITMPEPVEGIQQPHPGSAELIERAEKTIAGNIPMDEEGNIHAKSFRSVSPDLTGNVSISEPAEAGDILAIDPVNPGMMRLCDTEADQGVVGIVAGEPGVVLGGSNLIQIEKLETDQEEEIQADESEESSEELIFEFQQTHAPIALSGIVLCKVDAGYGAIQAGDLLTTSQTKGHAMKSDDHAAGTIIGKALEPLDAGTGLIKVLVMMR